MTLLKLQNVQTYYHMGSEKVRAVDGISFSVQEGENLGLVGESGCGKTTAIRSIIRVLPPNARIHGGAIYFQGKDLLQYSSEQMRQLRWKEIAMIPQSAMNSLDPVYRIQDQIVEVIQAHTSVEKKQALDRAHELFHLVGIPEHRLQDYPHQFSGGMKQRVTIAMALALEPSLVIADEPTTALDVIVQHQILMRIKELRRRLKIGMITVTHDISLVAQMCDAVAIMYAGKIVEYGRTADIFHQPFHPYTLGLQNAFPSLVDDREKLIAIPGLPPDLTHPPPGCRFAERCPFALAVCQEEPPMTEVNAGHFVACHRIKDIEELRSQARKEETWAEKSSLM